MSLPPGPRLPRALQAVGWTQRPLPFLERCQRRYGDTFTLRILHWGDWVAALRPGRRQKRLHRRRRGRGRRRQPAAGAGPRPALGDAAGRTRAHDPPQADAARLPRREHRSRRRDDGRGGAARSRPLAGRRAVRALAADAGDHPGGGDAGRLRRRGGRPPRPPARAAAAADRVDERPPQPRPCWPPSAPRGSSAAAATGEAMRAGRGGGAGGGPPPPRRGRRAPRTSSRCWSRPATRTARR